jgi:hypothetical protein
MTAAGY